MARRLVDLTTLLVVIFLMGPLVVIIAGSFTETPYVAFPPEGFTLKWYQALFQRQDFLESFIDSLLLAGLSTVVATVLGTLAALSIARKGEAGREFLRGFFMLPLILPTIVTGVALFQFMRTSEIGMALLPGNWAGLLLGHTLITIPYVVRTVGASLVSLDPSLAEAAEGLGASPSRVLFGVIMPAIMPAVMVSLIFCFILSFDQVTISIFLSGPDVTTLPIRIYNYIEFAIDPMIAAVSALLILFAYVLVLGLERTVGLNNAFGK
mgnify:CR=1 FL=1